MIDSQKKSNKFDNRRIFISDGNNHFQLFSFNQHKDGSIYCNWPNFIDTSWLVPILNKNGVLEIKTIDSVETGKLSIHGSGMCAFRPHDDMDNRPLLIKGNKLLDSEKNESGARHLFTVFPKEPSCLPNSPAFNRLSDYSINTSKLEPYVIIFFAIPQTQCGLRVNFQTSFNINDLESVPPKGGWGVIPLKFHDIFWFVYRTKYMEKWPKKSQIIYNDGFVVPFFIGTDVEKFRLEMRMPEYTLDKGCLTVKV